MSYQVLARKWRPRNFAGLVGQEHVVKALTHALTAGRLHHAYLLTGTRGVGKTTLARILAKSLNCEAGVSAEPCGACSACREIDAGRFVDLLEVDAATNTKVDEMRLLLENAVYAPTRGRYKVYVIDEVHMLSSSAFNAMLKTLEEPPDHVKFILATTDPQKIPVTVLSRCLQFNLKQMPPEAVVAHLKYVLDQEGVAFESPAIRLIARAGCGSMRDSLSLLDQAIAHGGGAVAEASVRAMLGTVDSDQVFEILEALANSDAGAMFDVAETFVEQTLSHDDALGELAAVLVRVQLAQLAASAVSDDEPFRDRILGLAHRLDPEFVQLAYQIAIHGRHELPLAPDAHAGFTMTLLRLLAFRPVSPDEAGAPRQEPPIPSRVATITAPGLERGDHRDGNAGPVPGVPGARPRAVAPAGDGTSNVTVATDWRKMVGDLKLSGMVRELAQHCQLREFDGSMMALRIASEQKHLITKAAQDKLQQALAEHFGRSVRLQIELGELAGETPASLDMKDRQARQESAAAAIEQDIFVREVVDLFDATLIESSIKPLKREP